MARRTSRRRTSRKLGTGSRFSALVRKLEARGGVSNPRALAAAIGRRKYGSRRFQQLAAAGRRRASLRRNGFSPAHRSEADFRWQMDAALRDLGLLRGDPVQGLRQAQIAIVYANILDDGHALALSHKYAKNFETQLRKALR